MQKVKVTRYVSGRRPEYAPEDSSGESSEEEEGFGAGGGKEEEDKGEAGGEEARVTVEAREEDDPRLRRLRERRIMVDTGRYGGRDAVFSILYIPHSAPGVTSLNQRWCTRERQRGRRRRKRSGRREPGEVRKRRRRRRKRELPD